MSEEKKKEEPIKYNTVNARFIVKSEQDLFEFQNTLLIWLKAQEKDGLFISSSAIDYNNSKDR